MFKKIGGLTLLAALICASAAQADPPPQFVVGLTEKGGNIAGVGSQTAGALTVSLQARQFDSTDKLTVIFMWPEGATDNRGNYLNPRRFECNKTVLADGTVLWTANVEPLRREILDTSQCLSFYFEAPNLPQARRYLSLNEHTFTRRRGVSRVDESLPLAIGCPDERADGSRALQILARDRTSKK